MSVASDTSDTNEPPQSRPSTLAEWRAPGKCWIRLCEECSEDLLCPSLIKREEWVIVFDTARSNKRRIFASVKWRNVTIPQWDEYFGKYGAKGKPYKWNPS
jgi:hypothetical protein